MKIDIIIQITDLFAQQFRSTEESTDVMNQIDGILVSFRLIVTGDSKSARTIPGLVTGSDIKEKKEEKSTLNNQSC